MTIRVYYEDTDVGGVVYYANYLKFCERARSEPFFSANISPISENAMFVIKQLCANYKSSAKLGDLLEVTTILKALKGASMQLHQQVLKDDTVLFEMDVTLAYVTLEGKPTKMGATLKASLQEFYR